jgi:glycerol-3-phosphate dehydrogenase
MARLNVEGSRIARALCEKLYVPHRVCGSLVVAFSDEENAHLRKLYERGCENGVVGMELLDGAAVRELEPNLSPAITGALYAPSAMIISPWEYCLALMEIAVRNGVDLHLDSEVTEIKKAGELWRVTAGRATYEAKCVINATGAHSDKIHNMAASPAFTIVPDRGEYYLLDKSEGAFVNHIVFQCPTKAGKGTLIAPTVHGNLIVGPNNDEPRDADDTATTGNGLAVVAERARKSAPALNFRANIRNFAGIRAAATGIDDFIIQEADGAPFFFDLAGIKSPGLSAAPAIARMAVEMIVERDIKMTPKDAFIDTRKRLRFAELSPAEKTALVKENPAFGRVICRCETVTEGEIIEALNAPIPPRSLDAVKRRCNAGMGRCQGGFCGPRVLELLAEYYQIPQEDVLLDKAGSFVLGGRYAV